MKRVTPMMLWLGMVELRSALSVLIIFLSQKSSGQVDETDPFVSPQNTEIVFPHFFTVKSHALEKFLAEGNALRSDERIGKAAVVLDVVVKGPWGQNELIVHQLSSQERPSVIIRSFQIEYWGELKKLPVTVSSSYECSGAVSQSFGEELIRRIKQCRKIEIAKSKEWLLDATIVTVKARLEKNVFEYSEWVAAVRKGETLDTVVFGIMKELEVQFGKELWNPKWRDVLK